MRYPGGGDGRVGLVLRDRCDGQPAAEDDRHHAQDGGALPDAADHLPEGVGERDRDAQDEREGQEIRQPGRVLERHGAVGVEEPAAVGAQLLDGLLEATGPRGITCLMPFGASWMPAGPARVCRAPWAMKTIAARNAMGSST